MQIDNEFTVSVPVEQAWAVLTDLAGIAPCMPGAQLTGVEGDVYSGRVKVKVGPVSSEYKGTAQFAQKDDATHHAVIDAKGRDARGAGNASALITAQLTPDGPRTVVNVSTDLKISGRIAQFGSGMIKEVSTKLLGQFVDNLETRLGQQPPAGDGPPSAAAPSGEAAATGEAAPAGQAAPSGAGSSGPAPAATASPGTAAAGPGPAGGAGPSGTPAAEGGESLNLMSVASSAIYKRMIPLVILILVIIGLIIYFAVS